MSSSGVGKQVQGDSNESALCGASCGGSFDWVGGADSLIFAVNVERKGAGRTKQKAWSGTRRSVRRARSCCPRKAPVQTSREPCVPTKQQHIIVRISTAKWYLPYQVRTTCRVPANVTPRDGIPKTVHTDGAKRIDVDRYIYKEADLYHRWQITHGHTTLLLPNLDPIRNLFERKDGEQTGTDKVHITVVRQPGDRRVRLAERMTKWRVVARMLVIAAKVQPKITLNLSNLGGDTVEIDARPYTTIKEVRRKYCEKTGVPRTPQLKLFAGSEPEPLRLMAQLKDYPGVVEEPYLTAFVGPLSRRL